MRKFDANFMLAWDDEKIQHFNFFVRTESTTPTSEQIKVLTDLGCTHIASQIFTAHKLSRETVQAILNLDFVKALSLSQSVHMEG